MIGADRKGGRYAKQEYVRARPFMSFLNDLVVQYEQVREPAASSKTGRVDLSPLEHVVSDIGWPVSEAAVRKLYRYRHGLAEGSSKGVKGPRRTEWFPRVLVENAMWCAGADFYEHYPEYSHERDVRLEPDAWCPSCQSHVTPINGVCPWDDWRISEGHMNRAAA